MDSSGFSCFPRWDTDRIEGSLLPNVIESAPPSAIYDFHQHHDRIEILKLTGCTETWQAARRNIWVISFCIAFKRFIKYVPPRWVTKTRRCNCRTWRRCEARNAVDKLTRRTSVTVGCHSSARLVMPQLGKGNFFLFSFALGIVIEKKKPGHNFLRIQLGYFIINKTITSQSVYVMITNKTSRRKAGKPLKIICRVVTSEKISLRAWVRRVCYCPTLELLGWPRGTLLEI